MTLTPVLVSDAVPTTSAFTHQEVSCTRRETVGAYHFDYLATGSNLQNTTVALQTVPDAVDVTDFPTIQRAAGVNSSVTAKFSNGRGTTDFIELDFLDKSGTGYTYVDKSPVADSYMEYSLARAKVIFDDLTGPNMFDASGNRAHVSTIPHASFTCHAYGGGWAAMGGLRFTAITPRHMVGVSHFGYSVNDVVEFRTVNNVPVYRTIQAVWRPVSYLANNADNSFCDMSVFLLSSSLPETITPALVAGSWISRIQAGSTANSPIFCPQYVGLTLWNNNGHITPSGSDIHFNHGYTLIPATVDGVSMSGESCGLLKEGLSVKILDNARLNYNDPTFYHLRTGGDSGSPCFAPVAGGWALCGLVSGNLWNSAKLNEAIARVDFHAGVSTGYTVTVAADPTL